MIAILVSVVSIHLILILYVVFFLPQLNALHDA